jgi:hypothetical protein
VSTRRGNEITRSRVLFRVRSSLVATERSFTFAIAGKHLESVPYLYGRHIVSAEILECQVQTCECLLEPSRNSEPSEFCSTTGRTGSNLQMSIKWHYFSLRAFTVNGSQFSRSELLKWILSSSRKDRCNELAAAAAVARAYYGVIHVSIHKKQVITIFIEYKWHIE